MVMKVNLREPSGDGMFCRLDSDGGNTNLHVTKLCRIKYLHITFSKSKESGGLLSISISWLSSCIIVW